MLPVQYTNRSVEVPETYWPKSLNIVSEQSRQKQAIPRVTLIKTKLKNKIMGVGIAHDD